MQFMMNDTISIIDSEGNKSQELKASVQKNKITIMQSDILITCNHTVERIMSNGGVEIFNIVDPGFHEAHFSIPAHYQMEVKKNGSPEAKKETGNITYNILGSNSRINNNSTDNSINTVYKGNNKAFIKIEELKN